MSIVDQEARDMATAAQSQIKSHEDVCAVRWAQAMETMKEVKDTLKSHTGFETWAMRTGLLILVGVVGWLFNKSY